MKELFIWKKPKMCRGPESADGVAADRPEEYSKKMLIRIVWQSADGSIADESEGEKIQILLEFWWFDCNIRDSLF